MLFALVLIAAFPAAGMKDVLLQGTPRIFFQAYLCIVVAAYFVWFWTHGGQTLPMKTWKFRLVRSDNGPLGLKRAIFRCVISSLCFAPACAALVLLYFPNRVSPTVTAWLLLPLLATLLWARFDADRQFLHDRLAGTRLVTAV